VEKGVKSYLKLIQKRKRGGIAIKMGETRKENVRS
jgi:hypothetical protein